MKLRLILIVERAETNHLITFTQLFAGHNVLQRALTIAATQIESYLLQDKMKLVTLSITALE